MRRISWNSYFRMRNDGIGLNLIVSLSLQASPRAVGVGRDSNTIMVQPNTSLRMQITLHPHCCGFVILPSTTFPHGGVDICSPRFTAMVKMSRRKKPGWTRETGRKANENRRQYGLSDVVNESREHEIKSVSIESLVWNCSVFYNCNI